jgi:hypothetical protein
MRFECLSSLEHLARWRIARGLRQGCVAVSFAAAILLGMSGCNKPSEDNCRKALSNIRHLLGTENLSQADQTIEGEVRRCRGGSRRQSVDCAIRAQTLDELRACKLVDLPVATKAATPPPPK